MHDIRLAHTNDEILATFDVMRQLRPALERMSYLDAVRRMQSRGGYQLAQLIAEGRVAAVAGFRFAHSLAWGEYVYVDDLVCDEAVRSRGHGSRLLDWIIARARGRGCTQLHLESGVQRFDAHRFYLRERMDITCHHFCRVL
jgi:GNAT superfamily N-acetyltransferase